MKKIMAALFAGLFVILVLVPNPSEARSVNLPSPQCHPSIVSSMPPRIRKICEALSTIWQFSDAMDNYLDEQEEEDYGYGMDPVIEPVKARNQVQVKRKVPADVDHVFLRFGKRG
jgi:hypothetical protein